MEEVTSNGIIIMTLKKLLRSTRSKTGNDNSRNSKNVTEASVPQILD